MIYNIRLKLYSFVILYSIIYTDSWQFIQLQGVCKYDHETLRLFVYNLRELELIKSVGEAPYGEPCI